MQKIKILLGQWVAESFFKTLKTEFIYGNTLVKKEEMKSMIFEYIEIYYNQKEDIKYLKI